MLGETVSVPIGSFGGMRRLKRQIGTLDILSVVFPKKAWYVLGFPVFSLEKKDFRKIYTIMGCSLAFYDRFEKLNYELETINNNLCRLSSLLEKSVHR